jgi:hypothetical protein
MFMKQGMPPEVMAEFAKYSPLPETLVTKIGEIMKQQQGKPNPMQEAELKKLIAEAIAINAKAVKDEADTAKIIVETGMSVVEANAIAEGMMQPVGMQQGMQPQGGMPMQ